MGPLKSVGGARLLPQRRTTAKGRPQSSKDGTTLASSHALASRPGLRAMGSNAGRNMTGGVSMKETRMQKSAFLEGEIDPEAGPGQMTLSAAIGASASGTNAGSKEGMPAVKSASYTAHKAGTANATTRFAERGGTFAHAGIANVQSVTNLTDSELQQVSNNERVTLDMGPSVVLKGAKSSVANMLGAAGTSDFMNVGGIQMTKQAAVSAHELIGGRSLVGKTAKQVARLAHERAARESAALIQSVQNAKIAGNARNAAVGGSNKKYDAMTTDGRTASHFVTFQRPQRQTSALFGRR